MSKKGRKRDNYTTTWGETIDGLGQLRDGRWVDLDDRAHPWTSSDEREAIREFRKRRSKRKAEAVPISTRKGDFWDIAQLQDALCQRRPESGVNRPV